MIDHHLIDEPEPPQYICYNLVFSERTRDIISLPAPSLFDSHARNGYTIMPADITAYMNEVQQWDAQVPPPQYYPPGPDGYYGW
jgi:hypothetical protein